MPAVNSQIVRSDYNAIRAKVVSVLGVGSGNTGWGQTARIRSSDVATGQKVTINEWANLRIDIINAYRQIAGSDPITAQVIEGGTIRYSSTFTPDTGTLDVPQKQYDDWINDVIANRFTIGTGRASTTATQTSTKTDAWNGNISCTIGFYWNTADEARYFFNSGGTIRVSSSRTGGTVSSQNTSWESLLSSVGTVSFGANTPGSGTTPSDGANWYRLTNSFQTFYTVTASSPYGSNTCQIQARVTDVASNTTGTSKSGEIRVLWNDGYTDPARTAVGRPFKPDYDEFLPEDLVDGTLTCNVSTRYATGLMAPDNSAFSIPQPTVGIGAISAAYTAPALETLSDVSVWFNGLITYLNAYLSEYRNPDFNLYALDGLTGFTGTGNLYDQYIIDGVVSGFPLSADMFDIGNFTLPWVSGDDGTYFDILRYLPLDAAAYARTVRYQTGRDVAQIVNINLYYRTFGYTDPNQLVNSTLPSKGGPYSTPLTVWAYRTGTNQTIGWMKIGELGADGLGLFAGGVIENGSTYNGFTVYAFKNSIYNSLNPSICDLHMIIGHSRWGSVFGPIQSRSISNTAFQNHYFYMTNCTNVLSGTTLLSRFRTAPANNGPEVTTAECQAVISAYTARMKAYFNF